MKYLGLLILLVYSIHAFSQADDDNTISTQYIVMLKPSHELKSLMAREPELQNPMCLSKRMNIWLFERGTSDGADNFLDSLRKDPDVKLAQFNHRIEQRNIVPNDTFFPLQWSLHNTGQGGGTPGADIDAEDAWGINHGNLTANGDTIVVAIVDVSFDITHPDLNFFINHHEIPNNGIDDDGNGYVDDYYGWNTIDSPASGNINAGGADDHSMHCSGIAGAITDNNAGIAGVCWGPQIMRICGASDEESQVVAAYSYLVDMRAFYDSTHGARGAFIVSENSSFGVGQYGANPADYPIWCAMYDSMGSYGILSATAGPDAAVDVDQIGDVPTGCPSNYMISVTNTTYEDKLLYGQACWGKNTIALGAPGSNIYSTYANDSYGYMTGTSMSAPHVAGAVAQLLASACPKLINDYYAHPGDVALAIKNMILTGTTQLSDLFNKTESGGRLNLYHAMLNLNEYNCNDCADAISLSFTQPTCSDSCNGTATVTSSGTSGYKYIWSTGDTNVTQLTGLCPGFYSVTATDGASCSQVRNFSIFQPDSLEILSISLRPAVPGDSGNIIITAEAGNYNLEYGLDTNNYQTGSTLIVNSNGTYNVYVRTQNGCVAERTVTLASIQNEQLSLEGNISLSPNPASDLLNILINLPQGATIKFSVLDALGRAMIESESEVPSGVHTAALDVSELANGVYFLRAATGSTAYNQKFLVLRK